MCGNEWVKVGLRDCFILTVNTLSCGHRAVAIIISLLRLIVGGKNVAEKHERLHVNWSTQQTQIRKNRSIPPAPSSQLWVSLRTVTGRVCLTNPSWFQPIIHQSHRAALGVRRNLL